MMAPNLTSTPTLFLAEAAVCPTSGSIPGARHRSAASAVASSPAKAAPAAAPANEPTAEEKAATAPVPSEHQWQIVWRNVAAFVYLHTGFMMGIWYLISGQARLYTFLWSILIAACGGLGITAGAHRLWAHRAYKAKWPLRVILMLFQTMAFQNHIYEWVRDHRVHHKFTDTDADPHNASRGFFFSHMGWLMVRKHPDVRRKGAGVDMSDLERDSVVMFQMKVYPVLMPLLGFVLPAWIPYRFWGEDGYIAWYVASIMRYTLTLHGTWLVNSAAHIWGTKPIDKTISPTENKAVAYIAFGEGWHNYHHVFPWDYKAAELGNYNGNTTTAFIDFFARIGWAYDLKTVSVEMVEKRVKRTGDGSHRFANGKLGYGLKKEHLPQDHHHGEEVWGWGDKDMSQEDILDATIINHSD